MAIPLHADRASGVGSVMTDEGRERVRNREIYAAAVEFESLLVQKMLSSMRSATESMSSKETAGTQQLSLYHDIADGELARAIAANGRDGLAAQLYRQLTGSPPDPELVATARHALPHHPGSAPASVPLHVAPAPDRRDLESIVARAAQRHRLPPGLAEAVVTRESDWDSTAVSAKGAAGLMQLMPETAAELGLSDLRDPRSNADAGARYLASLLVRFDDDVPLALAAYNAGPGAVERHGGIPPYPETQAYVQNVMLTWRSDDRLNFEPKETMLK